MARMTGGQALVRSVLAQGVSTLYALPGVQLDGLFNALHDEGEAVRVINARHEQGVGYMALGHALATGGVAAYAVVPGPGVLNAATPLATAYSTGARVLCLAGQIPSPAIGRGLGLLHEIPDQLGILQRLTQWAARIEHPAEAPGRVREAFARLASGRPRPVALEMAPDLLEQAAEVPPPETPPPAASLPLDDDLIGRAADLLGNARSPLIFVGAGVFGAEEALRTLAGMLQAPVVANRTGRGALSDEHYLSFTQPAGNRLWAGADVVLAVGTRLQHQRMDWGTDGDLQVIHVNIDGAELNRVARPAVGICADARDALPALVDAVARTNRARPSRRDELDALRGEVNAMLEAELAPQMAWLRALRAELEPDGILVDELTQVGYVARTAFPVYRPRTFITSGYQGTLGWGLATALGVKVARPERQVLSIHGDGGFLYTAAELATAVLHRIPIVAVVFNDNAYGNVRRMQAELYGGRVIASDLHNPDFVRMAESFGAAAYRADTPDTLSEMLRRAFADDLPALIEVPLGATPDPWTLIRGRRVRPRG